MTRSVKERSELGERTKIAQGGQGVVYRAPKVRTKFAASLVYKEYKVQVRAGIDFSALATMPALVENSLSYADGERLISIAAWPCEMVEDVGESTGFVMPAIPDQFYLYLTTMRGSSRNPAEFQHLLNEESVLLARGISIDEVQRLSLLREVASGLAFLHSNGVCVGDISPKNLLFSLTPREAIYFIDCDAMRINGVSALTQVETPGWEVPHGEELATIYSDTYKLGLLALRLLAGDQDVRNVSDLPPSTPNMVRRIITDSLRIEPQKRALPEVWTYQLGYAIEEAQHRKASQSADSPPTPAAPKSQAATLRPSAEPVIASTGAEPTNRAAVRGAVAAAAVVLIGVGAILLHVFGHGDSSQTTTTSSPPPNTGPFTGTYRAEFDPDIGLDGKPHDGSSPTTEMWRIRSVCHLTACVATASRVSGDTSLPTLVFDEIGDRWVGVGTASGSCANVPDEQFYVITLQPQPDGRLAGDLLVEPSQNCFDKRAVTFTRTGDVDVASLPDPADQAPRVVSPAEALHGHYRENLVHSRDSATVNTEQYDDVVQTYCLRTGDRCISYFNNSQTGTSLVFENGTWTNIEEYDGQCPEGGTSHVKLNGIYTLPQPPQDPITRLAGHGSQEESGTSCLSSDYDATFLRTGD